MSKQQQEKHIYYAAILTDKIGELLDDQHQDCISKEDLKENLTAFFHALATVMPCYIYNNIINDNKDHLEFNHIANKLCFQFLLNVEAE